MRWLLLLAFATGCASDYSINVEGDVLGTDRETPREVRAGIYPAEKGRAVLELAQGHLRPLADATVRIQLVHDRTSKLQSKVTDLETVDVNPRTGHFRCERHGASSNGPVEAVAFVVESPGRERVVSQFPAARGVPYEARLTVVLDQPPRLSSDSAK